MDGAPTRGGTSKAPPWRRPLTVVLCAALVLAVVGLAVVKWPRHHHPPFFCADIGLVGGVPAATPERALAELLDGSQQEPPVRYWKRHDYTAQGTVSFSNTLYASGKSSGHGWHSVQFTRTSDGWSVTGACV